LTNLSVSVLDYPIQVTGKRILHWVHWHL